MNKIKFGKDFWIMMKNLGLVVLGTVILAFGTAIFILPMNIISGGISGLSIIIKFLIPLEIITIDLIVLALTWILFFIGLLILGKPFAAKTFVSTVIYPFAVSAFMLLTDPNVLNGFFCLADYANKDLALILSASVGGVIIGCGCALTFIGGGSTGGVDVIAFAICKFFPRFKSSVVIFVVDFLTVLLGMIVIKDLIISLLGILSAFVTAVMIDKMFIGSRAAFVAYVVTDKYEEINEDIIKKLDRTTTVMEAKGGYTSNEKKVMMISVTMTQYAMLLAIIGKYDPKAFVIIHRAHEINGEGWNKLI